jgi:hypothetical protein
VVAARIRNLLDAVNTFDPGHGPGDRTAAAPRSVAVVRRVLELSTAHLPPAFGAAGLDDVQGVIAFPTDRGFLMWVPDDPDDSHLATADPVPDVVLTIQRYARSLECDYVLFDADGHHADALPAWTW